ncbi:MAG TPA: plastocyanin/azurin family copper-binding protein [Balneolaceae bacterium]|nr:plastocyanin/azurin family copper-binding protein [Balneolaceae bacterium]
MKKYLFSSIIIALALSFTACGGGETADQAATQQEPEVETNDGVRHIEIIGTDDMKFAVRSEANGLVTGGVTGQNFILESIVVEPGEEIRITLTTISNLPPAAMSHNFVLLEQGADADAFARASLVASDNEYIAPSLEDQVIIHTSMLGNGESDTITFTAPEETGEHTFLCSFPGHYAGGMIGTLVVE